MRNERRGNGESGLGLLPTQGVCHLVPLQMDQLAREWAQKWNGWQAIMEHYGVDINRRRARVVIDSSLPHLMALEDDVLNTGVVLYHLKVRRLVQLLFLSTGPK